MRSAATKASSTDLQPLQTRQTLRTLYIRAPPVSQHFWHFMMGEFLPVMHLIATHKPDVVYISKKETSCPFNSFYSEVTAGTSVRLHISDTEEVGATHPPYMEPLPWDLQYHGEQHKLLQVVRFLKAWATHPQGARSHTPPHTHRTHSAKASIGIAAGHSLIVQERVNTKSMDAYYKKDDTRDARGNVLPNRKQYGAVRRHVTNLADVADALRHIQQPPPFQKTARSLRSYRTPPRSRRSPRTYYGCGRRQQQQQTVRVICDDGMTLKQQIRHYVDANVLVLGHGAGMVQMLWMRPRSVIVEIIPKKKSVEKNGAVQGCKRLTKLLHFALERVVLPNTHGDVNVNQVLNCLRRHHVGRMR
jgi:hypothetical protein